MDNEELMADFWGSLGLDVPEPEPLTLEEQLTLEGYQIESFPERVGL